jgi:acetyl esterase
MSGESAKEGIENGAFEASVEPLLRGTLVQLDLLRAGYLPDLSQYRSPLASPIYAEDLSRFPETHILTAEIDVLRPEGERFAELLEKAGVTVSVTRYPGALHMSSMLTKTWPTAKRWQDDCLAILNDVHAPARSADA